MSSCRHRGLPAPIGPVPQLRRAEALCFRKVSLRAVYLFDQNRAACARSKTHEANDSKRLPSYREPATLRVTGLNLCVGRFGPVHTNSRTDSPSPHRSLCQQVHSFLRARPLSLTRLALRRCKVTTIRQTDFCHPITSKRVRARHGFPVRQPARAGPHHEETSVSRRPNRFDGMSMIERGVVFPNRSARPPLTSRRRQPICSMPLARALALGRRQVRFSSYPVKSAMFHEQRCLRFWQVLLLEASSIRTTLPPCDRRSTSLRNIVAIVCHAAGVIRRYFRCARFTVTHLAVFLAEMRFSESDAACPLLQHT